MPPGGYFGRALIVDLGNGGSEARPLSDATLCATIGGVGLGTRLISEFGAAGVDPLAPEAPLAFVFSPLVGTPLWTSAGAIAGVAAIALTRVGRLDPVDGVGAGQRGGQRRERGRSRSRAWRAERGRCAQFRRLCVFRAAGGAAPQRVA